MLIYHPAFDLYNCIFRMLLLINNSKESKIELDRIRIWDFYLVFPREAQKIRFPRELSKLKTIFKTKKDNPYEDLLDSKLIMNRMNPFQISALKCLASYGLIDHELLKQKIIKRTDKNIPEELLSIYNELTVEKQNILKLVTGFHDILLYGPNGLKARTGLIEFKYDSK